MALRLTPCDTCIPYGCQFETPLPVQLSANAAGKAAADGPSAWILLPHGRPIWSSTLLAWPDETSAFGAIRGVNQQVKVPSLSPSLSYFPSFSLLLCLSNKFINVKKKKLTLGLVERPGMSAGSQATQGCGQLQMNQGIGAHAFAHSPSQLKKKKKPPTQGRGLPERASTGSGCWKEWGFSPPDFGHLRGWVLRNRHILCSPMGRDWFPALPSALPHTAMP